MLRLYVLFYIILGYIAHVYLICCYLLYLLMTVLLKSHIFKKIFNSKEKTTMILVNHILRHYNYWSFLGAELSASANLECHGISGAYSS